MVVSFLKPTGILARLQHHVVNVLARVRALWPDRVKDVLLKQLPPLRDDHLFKVEPLRDLEVNLGAIGQRHDDVGEIIVNGLEAGHLLRKGRMCLQEPTKSCCFDGRMLGITHMRIVPLPPRPHKTRTGPSQILGRLGRR
jgi:hypothetical protein